MEMLLAVFNICFIFIVGYLQHIQAPYFWMMRTFAIILYTTFILLMFALLMRVFLDGTDKPTGLIVKWIVMGFVGLIIVLLIPFIL